jgi:hypothetical protein
VETQRANLEVVQRETDFGRQEKAKRQRTEETRTAESKQEYHANVEVEGLKVKAAGST